jgi:hypothetical protein
MNKIVIVSDKKEEKGGLAALLHVLFPDCEITLALRLDGALSPHGMDDDQGGRSSIHPFDYEQ